MTPDPASPSVIGIARRDIERLRGIAIVAARHGFGALLTHLPLSRQLVDRPPAADAELQALGAPLEQHFAHFEAEPLETGIDEMRLLGVVAIVEEFETVLLGELDFHQELAHLREFHRHLDPARRLKVRQPCPALSAVQ